MNTTLVKSKMKILFTIALLLFLFTSCSNRTEKSASVNQKLPITGTWKLLTGTIIEGADTSVTDYTVGQEFIKIINESHFAFFNHDFNAGKDSSAVFVAGAGKYSLEGNKYTESLEYCNFRDWENHDFEFELTINDDTMTIRGVEKLEELNINRVNIEKYVRVSK